MKLAEYLAAPRPAFDFVHGDCSRWVDSWVRTRGYASPMQAIGVQYASERAALRRIAEGGGLVALWLKGMTAIGVKTCASESLRAGDVGVIHAETYCGINEATGIWTGTRWATLSLRGLSFAPAPVLAAWRL